MTPVSLRSGAVDALLGEYAQGSLPLPLHVMMAAHLDMKGGSRGFVDQLECSLARDMNACDMEVVRNRHDRLTSIFDSQPTPEYIRKPGDVVLPPVLASYLGKPMDEIRWKRRLFGMKEHQIEVQDGVEASLIWVKAGSRMPSHTHVGSEITLVLTGSFSDAHGQYRRGDVVVADSDIDHDPVIDKGQDCICFVVTDAPLRLTGPVGRLFSRLFGH